MKINYNLKQIYTVIVFSIFLILVSISIYERISYGENADLIQDELINEFNTIKPLPNSISSQYKATHKTTNALVSANYSTNLSYEEIRRYYDSELTSQGWQFKAERPVLDWGRDFGGKTIDYCKGSYEAEIQYFGEDKSYGGNYSLSLSWKMKSVFEKWLKTCR
jgi:hypothetical protein